MTDIIVLVILVILVGGASAYIINAKKSGVKCIGCPAGGSCARGHREAAGGRREPGEDEGDSAGTVGDMKKMIDQKRTFVLKILKS